ncbi:MAG: hypothetical protein U0527_05475 [Candidatus Eisenbacteria bacterium]
MDIIDELRAITTTLDREGVAYALCGGLAMAVYAMPRATLDIDLLIQTDSLPQAIRVLEPLGFSETSDPMEFGGGKVLIRRFSKLDPPSTELLVLDLLLVTDATTQAWEGRQTVDWEGRKLCVVSPEGLISLKELRGSGKDRDDIEYLRSILDED